MRVISYTRPGPIAEIAIEQVIEDVRCKECGFKAQTKD